MNQLYMDRYLPFFIFIFFSHIGKISLCKTQLDGSGKVWGKVYSVTKTCSGLCCVHHFLTILMIV